MTDLNTLVPAGTPLLLYANDINDRGEITGEAFDSGSGTAPAYLLVPAGERQEAAATVSRAPRDSGRSRVAVPDSVRRQVARRFALGSLDSER
jgi:hypothetical protein